jgi:hypothetical protein
MLFLLLFCLFDIVVMIGAKEDGGERMHDGQSGLEGITI